MAELSYDVWCVVTEHLTHPSDMLALRATCRLLRDVVENDCGNFWFAQLCAVGAQCIKGAKHARIVYAEKHTYNHVVDERTTTTKPILLSCRLNTRQDYGLDEDAAAALDDARERAAQAGHEHVPLVCTGARRGLCQYGWHWRRVKTIQCDRAGCRAALQPWLAYLRWAVQRCKRRRLDIVEHDLAKARVWAERLEKLERTQAAIASAKRDADDVSSQVSKRLRELYKGSDMEREAKARAKKTREERVKLDQHDDFDFI
jgi:hypothetical protein